MWQEARKQEKKIRGMMVDHKKVLILQLFFDHITTGM